MVGARSGVHVTGYLALFPLIILTHMVERFWTVEAEDGAWSSFKTLLGTLVVSVVVAVALSPDAVGRRVFRFPETLGRRGRRAAPARPLHRLPRSPNCTASRT